MESRNWGPLSPSALRPVGELAMGTHPIPVDGFSSVLSVSPPGPAPKVRLVSAPHTAPPAVTSQTATRSPEIPPCWLGFCSICLLSLSPIAIVTPQSRHKAPSVPPAAPLAPQP